MFGKFCYISILNYVVKETEQEESLQEFSEHFASQTAINRPHRKYWLGNFFFAGDYV